MNNCAREQVAPAAMIREATVAERPVVADITRRAYEEYASASDPSFWTKYVVSTQQTLLNDETGLRLVAEVEGQIGATVFLCPPAERRMGGTLITNPHSEMRLLAVLPEFRNFGLAALLIEECERRVLASGAESITLHTTRLMMTAKAMYERRGYVRYEQIDFEPAPGFVVWGYIKRLTGGNPNEE